MARQTLSVDVEAIRTIISKMKATEAIALLDAVGLELSGRDHALSAQDRTQEPPLIDSGQRSDSREVGSTLPIR